MYKPWKCGMAHPPTYPSAEGDDGAMAALAGSVEELADQLRVQPERLGNVTFIYIYIYIIYIYTQYILLCMCIL